MALNEEQRAAWLKLREVWATTPLNVRETIEGEIGMAAIEHRRRAEELTSKGVRTGGTHPSLSTSVDFYGDLSRGYESILNLLDKLDET